MSVALRACVAVRVSDKYPPLFSKHRNTVSVASMACVATLAKELGFVEASCYCVFCYSLHKLAEEPHHL